MYRSAPLSRDLVLIGGGHSHALVLRMWGMNPLPGARLTVIDPNPVAPYTGMLPGLIAGHYRKAELEIDLVRLARFAGARLVIGAVTDLDAEQGRLTVGGRGEIGFDVASIDVGIHSGLPGLPGFADHAVAAKPLGPFADAWEAHVAKLSNGRDAQAAVIGGGIAGIELAMAMAHRLRQVVERADVTLIERADTIAPEAPGIRDRLMRACEASGVRVLAGADVAGITSAGVILDDGRMVEAGFVVSAAGAQAHGWLSGTGLPVTQDGFVRVGKDLRVEGHEALFAAGDCAYLSHAPRPKAGVFAVRAAPVLRDNLRAVLSGGRTRAFHPQRDYLKLVSLGKKSALAEKMGVTWSGPLLWRLKDRIDRKFMAQFAELPQMSLPQAPRQIALSDETQTDPLCGGCGAKVAPSVLSALLAKEAEVPGADVLTGPGDDAAVIRVGGVKQVLTTDHLRGFTEDLGVLARIAALHALGDVWAMGARPQAALLSVTLPRMSEALQARSMAEIMAHAKSALSPAGARIVGGHSTMGAEASIGFTVTGLLEQDPITVAGARPGDALILTRPIGSGVLFAAEMRGLADGRDVAALLEILQRPQGDAAEILAGAHAMTDVTGFGLAGHLMAICRASGLGAEIDLDAIPVYQGAEALAADGVRSTLWAANAEAAPVEGGQGPRADLLHDPQTAGGLLAAVEAGTADEVIAKLRRAGHAAARIGHLPAGPAIIRCIRSDLDLSDDVNRPV